MIDSWCGFDNNDEPCTMLPLSPLGMVLVVSFVLAFVFAGSSNLWGVDLDNFSKAPV